MLKNVFHRHRDGLILGDALANYLNRRRYQRTVAAEHPVSLAISFGFKPSRSFCSINSAAIFAMTPPSRDHIVRSSSRSIGTRTSVRLNWVRVAHQHRRRYSRKSASPRMTGVRRHGSSSQAIRAPKPPLMPFKREASIFFRERD